MLPMVSHLWVSDYMDVAPTLNRVSTEKWFATLPTVQLKIVSLGRFDALRSSLYNLF